MTEKQTEVRKAMEDLCDSRYAHLSHLFDQGGYTYAVGPSMAARVPVADSMEGDSGAPKMDCVFKQLDLSAKEWVKFASLDIKVPAIVKCDRCSGSGGHYCHECDETHDCKRCGATGSVAAPPSPVQVGPARLNSALLYKLTRLPNLEFAVQDPKAAAMFVPVSFRFDGGGEGLVCVLRTDN